METVNKRAEKACAQAFSGYGRRGVGVADDMRFAPGGCHEKNSF
jgi:hypothetical protein